MRIANRMQDVDPLFPLQYRYSAGRHSQGHGAQGRSPSSSTPPLLFAAGDRILGMTEKPFVSLSAFECFVSSLHALLLVIEDDYIFNPLSRQRLINIEVLGSDSLCLARASVSNWIFH